jgi:hypothetical protein
MSRRDRRRRAQPLPIPETIPADGSSVLWMQWPGWADNAPTAHVLDFMTVGTAASESWPVVLSRTAWFVIRSTAMRGGIFADKRGDTGGTLALARVLWFCRQHGIRVALNVPSRYQCDGRVALLADIRQDLVRIADLGHAVGAVQAQSVVSGAVQSDHCKAVYPKGGGGIARNLEDLASLCATVLPIFGDARIVIADTSAAKTDDEHNTDWDYRRDYLYLANGMVRLGLPIPSFHLAWAKEEAAADLSDIRAAATFFRANRLTWGLKPISDSANDSALVFAHDLIAFVADLKRYDCLSDELNLTSWNRAYPDRLWPETDPGTLTGAGLGWVGLGVIQPRSA